MNEKEFNEIIDRIKGTTDKRLLARIAHAAMISLCQLVQTTGITSELTLEGGYVSQIDYDLIFPKKEAKDDTTGV